MNILLRVGQGGGEIPPVKVFLHFFKNMQGFNKVGIIVSYSMFCDTNLSLPLARKIW